MKNYLIVGLFIIIDMGVALRLAMESELLALKLATASTNVPDP
jgi:hypothetical protein